MRIKVCPGPGAQFFELNIERGVTIEDVYKRYFNDLPYTVLYSKVDSKYEELTYEIERPCKIEFLDMRNGAAAYAYCDTLTMLYMSAVKKILGNVPVYIHNSLNQGFYSTIGGRRRITRDFAQKVTDKIHEYIDNDEKVKVEYHTLKETARILHSQNAVPNGLRLLHKFPDETKIKVYFFDGSAYCTLDSMLPSAGYIDKFELRPYKNGMVIRYPKYTNPVSLPPYFDQKDLYKAFEEQESWDELLGVKYVADLNDVVKKGQIQDLIRVSEALHEKKIAEIADLIKQRGKRVILIAGPSSSGKTTFAQRLRIQLRVNGIKALYLGTDDYFIEREETPLGPDGKPDYEGLDVIDRKLFNKNIKDLLAGKEVDLPTFNFIEGHKEYGKRITRLEENQIIIIEGIHGLNDKLTEMIPKREKFKIYASPLTQLNVDEHTRISTSDVRLLRRIVRDSRSRGSSAAHTIDMWKKVRSSEEVNIFPYSDSADVLFNSYHVYEISVLKEYAVPLLRTVRRGEAEYAEAERLLRFLAMFDVIEDNPAILNNSIIREFIGGSAFVN